MSDIRSTIRSGQTVTETRQTKYQEIDQALINLENLSVKYSDFIEYLKVGSIPEQPKSPGEQVLNSFVDTYNVTEQRIRDIQDRFEMHLDMLRELIN